GELTIVADCYNANPESFEAAIRYCADSFPGRRLGVVAGTMLELGPAEASAHADVAIALLDSGFSLIVAVGAFQIAFQSMQVPAGVEVVYAERVEAVSDLLAERLNGDEVLLVKGSRGVRLERVIDDLVGGRG
ncbi:MAG: UDP-N-acetylmuramoyl-tripeptide--D-alanyl-D-alanine ligase, partial [Gemmatimonadetes bacterium]|nr:UDP-N-acetylmuramoyl-tripeptide--D-alanyl-D-alanine ligase [Gemmatimonadota bacterium]